uniref:AlNc14C214G8971 protein n=1 Tax=Albugo laibachii Nc14 TaxID=890382 RepID=F0WRG9_9STRA|nr:AlNc14C214G8971 [Albugo laibachii Nc14]|eukprot:CCA23932.1 AlNc14C214G8971 [Albugo laibachii Nc14]
MMARERDGIVCRVDTPIMTKPAHVSHVRAQESQLLIKLRGLLHQSAGQTHKPSKFMLVEKQTKIKERANKYLVNGRYCVDIDEEAPLAGWLISSLDHGALHACIHDERHDEVVRLIARSTLIFKCGRSCLSAKFNSLMVKWTGYLLLALTTSSTLLRVSITAPP